MNLSDMDRLQDEHEAKLKAEAYAKGFADALEAAARYLEGQCGRLEGLIGKGSDREIRGHIAVTDDYIKAIRALIPKAPQEGA